MQPFRSSVKKKTSEESAFHVPYKKSRETEPIFPLKKIVSQSPTFQKKKLETEPIIPLS